VAKLKSVLAEVTPVYGTVISNRIGMKFGSIIPQINALRLLLEEVGPIRTRRRATARWKEEQDV